MKADEGLCVFGAEVMDVYLEDMIQEVDGVRQASDTDPIHDMRVASRRMRAALPLFEGCFPKKKFPEWLKQIKRITKALGAARDLDVQIERVGEFLEAHDSERFRPGLLRLQLRLRQRRARAQQKVTQALDALEESHTSVEIKKRLKPYLDKRDQVYLYPPALYQAGHDAIQEKLEDLLAYDEFVHQPDKIAELHAMRIAAKRLRYTMEIFAPLYPGELKETIQAARKAQDLLGEVHDADVWIGFIPQFIEDERKRTLDYFGSTRSFHRLTPGITCFLEDRQTERENKYHEFVDFWEKHQAPEDKATWQKLQQTIQIPYYQGEQPSAIEEAPAEPTQGGEAG